MPERTSKHRFARFADRVQGGVVTDVDVMYRCDACKHERVWGSIDPAIFRSHFVH